MIVVAGRLLTAECRLLGEPAMARQGDTRQVGLTWIPGDEVEQWPFWPKAIGVRIAAGVPRRGAEYLGDIN